MGVGYNPRCVQDGLVLYLDAANRRSYPQAGSTWTDLSGRGNNGILTNGPTYSSVNGGSIVFDGSNNYVEFQSISVTMNSFTTSCWFKTTSSSDVKIFSIQSSYHPIQIFNGVMRMCVNGCSLGSTLINDNTWRMATVVGDSSFVKLYLNNNSSHEISQSSSSTVMSGVSPRLGRDGGTFGFYYSGNLVDFKLYSRPLSINEIRQNFNATRSRFGI